MENNIAFYNEVQKNIELMSKDRDFLGISKIWNIIADQYKYSYNFTWLGRPIIQLPQDICVHQELIWKVKPDLIIETGIAHGGSLILHASMIALISYCESRSSRIVVGIDNDIRPHNREEIEKHPLSTLIQMIQGSSTDPSIIKQVTEVAKCHEKVMIFLDSNHTHNHVLDELKAYAPLVSINSYCIVCDTGIEDMPEYLDTNKDRPWGKGNNPKTAICEYLKTTDKFKIDITTEHKLAITSSPGGFLQRIK